MHGTITVWATAHWPLQGGHAGMIKISLPCVRAPRTLAVTSQGVQGEALSRGAETEGSATFPREPRLIPDSGVAAPYAIESENNTGTC